MTAQDRGDAARRRELVARLAQRRVAAGLSQADVAELMRTSQSAVARLESRKHDAQLSTLARYAEALELAGAGPAAKPKGRPPRREPADGMPAVTAQPPGTPGPDRMLTARQHKVLQVIRESIEKRGHPPSLREIGDAVGLASTSSVSHHLSTLQRAGYLNRDSGRPRTVEVRDYTAVLRVRSGTCFGLRRNAYSVRAVDQPDGQRWDLLATRFADMDGLAGYAASYGANVVVIDPPELREAVIAKLKMARLKVRPATPAPTAPGGVQAKPHVVMPDSHGVKAAARAIADAVKDGRRVHLLHYNPKTDEVTERDVDPIGLIRDRGRPYLHGWCLLREEWRFFRLDRVLRLDVLDVPASPPAELLNADQTVFRPSHDDERVELELAPGGRWVMDYYPCEPATELADGWVRVALLTPDTGWVWRLALRLGEDGRVVSPPELAAEIRRVASAALENYQPSAPPPSSVPPCSAPEASVPAQAQLYAAWSGVP